ncbi:hypothetical protein PanWU01x14_113230 [Parasponia andersonii]|uniref:Uncharacterized protein n=1 Tax=Parasponia andersonii TaxID=3476 RepID=A0A2P5CXR2_PARAD|nr:hypothetical protein PanWU01x14_113230 [Parasponia andersonii]
MVVTHEASLKLLNKWVHRWVSRVEQKNLLSGDYGLDMLQSMGTTVTGPGSGGLGRASPCLVMACLPASTTWADPVESNRSHGRTTVPFLRSPNRLRRAGLGRDRPPRVRGPIWACEEDDPSSQ